MYRWRVRVKKQKMRVPPPPVGNWRVAPGEFQILEVTLNIFAQKFFAGFFAFFAICNIYLPGSNKCKINLINLVSCGYRNTHFSLHLKKAVLYIIQKISYQSRLTLAEDKINLRKYSLVSTDLKFST